MTWLSGTLPPSERLIFESEAVCIGTVRCAPDHADFRDCGGARSFCFVFPRSAVIIRQPERPAFTEDPTVISFYNQCQPYERLPLSPDGDRCEWFGIAPAIVREAVRPYDHGAADDERRPLRMASVRSRSASYLRQRLLVEQLTSEPAAVDALEVEETVLGLLDRAVADAYAVQTRRPSGGTATRDLAEHARRVLARHFREPITLTALAASLDTSVFHLCRVFRHVCGTSIHQHLTELRVRAAVEPLRDRSIDLARLAVDLGFSTHSHFTAVFRRRFGRTPSEVRAAISRRGTPRP